MFPIRVVVPTRYPPVFTWALIAVNCAVFFLQLNLSPTELEDFIYRFALVPARYAQGDLDAGDIVPLFTSMFLHGGWLHLIFNMWTLWLFGPPVEDRLGHGRYLVFYLACGIAAGITQVVFSPDLKVPVLGASGAIAGVLGCSMRLFPLARVVVLVLVIIFPLFFELPGFVFVGLWFLLQVLQGTAELLIPSTVGGIAWWAHVGGFLAGLVLGPVLLRPRRLYRKYYADEGVLGFDASGRR